MEQLWSYGAIYSITTFIGGISPPLQIRQVARLRSTTSNLQVLSPTREEHTNNPVQKPNFRGHAGTKARTRVYKPPTVLQDHQGRENKRTSVDLAASSLLSDFRLDPSVLPAPPCLGGSAAVPAIPLVPVASSWTGTSTHAAQTQAGTTRAGTQRHVGLAARACTETSMHAAQTQARTQHKPPE